VLVLGWLSEASLMAIILLEVLGRIAQHLDDGTLRMPIQRLRLDQARELLWALASDHTEGKLSLRVG
jgi:hypothetical protein